MEDDIINSVIMNDVLNHLRSQPNDSAIFLDGDGDHGIKLKKEFRKNEQKKRQELYGTRLAKYNKRIDEIQKQKVINDDKKGMETCQKEERIKNALLDLKIQDKGKRLKLINYIKSKEKKSQNLIIEMKNQKIREKQNKDIERYFDKVNRQNRTIVENQNLIEECLEHVIKDNNKELSVDNGEEMEDEKIEETQEEECVIDSDQSKLKVICEERESMMGDLQMYLQRIYRLKKNFCSCEAGRHFFLKTGPIWDSLTQCIYRKSQILREMNQNFEDKNMPEEYRRVHEEVYDNMAALAYKQARGSHSIDTKFLKTLMTDTDYEFNDKDIYDAVLKAKRLIGKSATALEILDLVKMILECEFDTNDSVWYIVSGLYRRTVFEYAKRRMSYRILAYSQNTVKRLQSLNNINLIPKRLLIAKNTSENQIESLVLAFLTDDVKYGYLNAEEHKMLTENVYRNEVEKRMREFVKNNYKKVEDTDKIYPMPLKTILKNHADLQIDRLMVFVYKQIVPVLCKKSNNTMTLHLLEEKLTHGKFNILARKLTKMVFGMGGTYDEKIYVLEVIMEKIGIEITKRSPTIQYKSKTNAVAKEKEVDFSYFRKKLGDLKTPKKPIKKK